jgi:hypothetical protein
MMDVENGLGDAEVTIGRIPYAANHGLDDERTTVGDYVSSMQMSERLNAEGGQKRDENSGVDRHGRTKEDYKVEITKIYERHNPEKLADPGFIAATLLRYQGKEHKLLKKLKKQVRWERGKMCALVDACRSTPYG